MQDRRLAARKASSMALRTGHPKVLARFLVLGPLSSFQRELPSKLKNDAHVVPGSGTANKSGRDYVFLSNKHIDRRASGMQPFAAIASCKTCTQTQEHALEFPFKDGRNKKTREHVTTTMPALITPG